MVYVITQDREKCVGCGACVALCPNNWKLAGDGKAKPIKTKVIELSCNTKAAEICPVKCISIKEEWKRK